tara:strand:- start:1178 stop:2551 length:1374 start_codon:yes stop_codon:yes gene_type:complete
MGRFLGSTINKGTGGGGDAGSIKMSAFNRDEGNPVGVTTDANNNITQATFGETTYSSVGYNGVGLITGFKETIGADSKEFRVNYNSAHLVSHIEDLATAPNVSVASTLSSLDEGSQLVFNCSSTNVPAGSTLYWDVKNGGKSGVSTDFSPNSGSFTLVGTAGTFTVTPSIDGITETDETFNAYVYDDSGRTHQVGQSISISIVDSAGSGGGGSQSNPANINNWSAFIAGKSSSSDGKHWIQAGSEVFETWVTFRDGGWIKVAQMNGNNDVMSNSSAINAGGSWIDAEINTNQHGKLTSTAINTISHQAFMMRVTGSPTDNFLNSRAGSFIFEYVNSETLPNWGTAVDPTGTYDLKLDHDNSGSGMEIMRYAYESRTLCSNAGNHPGNGSYWVSDHNYNGTWQNQIWGASSAPMCWTISNNRIHTNMHWMGGPAGYSGGNQQWGDSSNNAVAFFLQPQ